MKIKTKKIKTIILVLLIVAFAVIAYFAVGAKLTEKKFRDDSRPMVNAFFAEAGVPTATNWSLVNKCGPVGNHLGYELISDLKISEEESDNLVKTAKKQGLAVQIKDSYLGAGFKNRIITNENWTVTIYEDTKDQTWRTVRIGTFEEIPPGLKKDPDSICY